MRASRSDEELLQICLRESLADVDPQVVAELKQRCSESDAVRAAIEASPMSELLLARFAELDNAPQKRSGWRVVRVVVALLLAVAAGVVTSEWMTLKVRQAETADEAQQSVAAQSDESDDASTKTASNDDARDANSNAMPSDAGSQPVALSIAEKDRAGGDSKPGVAEDGVWSGPLDPLAPPLSVESTVWQPTAAVSPDGLHPDVFRQWFAAVPDRSFKVSEDKVKKRSFTAFEGVARLKAPWREAAVLRLALFNTDRCEISFWRGNDGVRFSLHKEPAPALWIAHRISRADEKAKAELGELLGTDNSRWEITRSGIFELRVENGQLMFARGHVPLLRVPYEGRPQEVVFDGKFRLRDLRMYRGDPLPTAELDAYRGPNGANQLSSSSPAELQWTLSTSESASFEKTTTAGASGATAVELKTTAALKETAAAVLKLSKAGLSEFIFRIEHADPGTGISIGSAEGVPYCKLSFLSDPSSKRIVAAVPAPWLQPVELTKDTPSLPLGIAGPTQWFRMIGSAASLQVWVSPDGRDWSWLGQHQFPTEWRRVEALRIIAQPGAARRIRLSHLEVRELPTFAGLADPQLCQRVDLAAFEPLMTRDLGSWTHQMIRSRPDDVPLPAWRRACAVETLRAGAHYVLSQLLLSGLAYDGLFGDGSSSAEVQRVADEPELERGLLHDLHLLAELALLHHLADYNNGASYAQLWWAVADKWVALSDALPVAQRNARRRRVISERFMEAMLVQPLRNAGHMKLLSFDGTRRELVSLEHAGRWADTLDWLDRLTFFVTDSHPLQFWWTPADASYNVVQWAELNALPSLDADSQLRRLTQPRRWKSTPPLIRHALAQPLSKEAYNVMAEFNAAMSRDAFGDACQIIGAAANGELLGILPDSRDPQLMVSFPRSVALAMEEHPELRATMNEKYGAIGRLRVRQAMEVGDAQVLEAATVQFFGTLAAAESERWLGDRAFSAGEFAQAHAHYLRARDGFARHSQVQTKETLELAARMQLVSAMLGTEMPAPVTSSVAFGEQIVSKEQLDALARDLLTDSGEVRSRDVASQRTQTTAKSVSSENVPPFRGYRWEQRARFAGDLGERVGGSATLDIDWFSRQFAVTVSDGHAFMCNRFQLNCMDLETGAMKWAAGLGGEQGVAHQWPMVPMQPLVTESTVFCRRLIKAGPELQAFDRSSGKQLWRAALKTSIVSDPWIVRGRLQAFAADESLNGPVELRLLTLHAETGRVLSESSVIRLFDDLKLSGHACQVAVRDGLIYYTVSGVVGCCDLEGQSVWLRRQLWQPQVLDTGRHQRAFDPLHLHGDVLLVTQPGVPVIEALEASSGRLRWSRSAADHRRMLGLNDGRLLTETQAGIEAINAETGALEWRYRAGDLLDAVVTPSTPATRTTGTEQTAIEKTKDAAAQRSLLVMRPIEVGDSQKSPTLVWIDAATGREIGFHVARSIRDKTPRCGPLLATGQKIYCFYANGYTTGDRQIFELVPSDDEAAVRTIDQRLWAGWLPEFSRTSFPKDVSSRPSFARRPLTPAIRDAYAKHADDWVVIAPLPQPKDAGTRAEFRGEKNVLALSLTLTAATIEQNTRRPETPLDAARFVKHVTVATNAEAALNLRVGHDAGRSWELIVDAGSQRLHRSIVNDESAPDGWRDVRIDLSTLSVRSTELVVTCVPLMPSTTWIYMARGLK